MSSINKYSSLQKSERKLFREALYKSFVCKWLLLFRSFKNVSGQFAQVHDAVSSDDTQLLNQISKAVKRTNSVINWKNACLINTLVARWMLNDRKIKSKAYLGSLIGEEREFHAHAWLESNGIPIVPKESEFSVLHEF